MKSAEPINLKKQKTAGLVLWYEN